MSTTMTTRTTKTTTTTMTTKTTMNLADVRSRAAGTAAGAVAGRPSGLTLGPDWTELPAASELAALLPRVRVAWVRLAEPVDLTELPDEAVARVVALLRECASIGVEVAWSLTLDEARLDLIPGLDHLPAPERITVAGKGPMPVDRWRSARSFGLFYFRKGPDFISVVDRRPESSSRIIVDDGATMEVFQRCLDACAWSEATRSPEHAAVMRDLIDERMVIRFGDHCVTVPAHMRSWPTPLLDV